MKGLGVRATNPIPAGTFIGEYVGEKIDERESEIRNLVYESFGLMFVFRLDIDATAEEEFGLGGDNFYE